MSSTLTIDVGNSHLTLALYSHHSLLDTHRIHTRPFLTSGQLVEEWNAILRPRGLHPKTVHLSVSSVVPDYNGLLKEAGTALGAASFHWVDADSPHGFSMQDSARREIGADLLAGLVGARSKARGALVVVDCGTATTLALLSAADQVLGVAILPGIKTQIRMLMEKAPHLADAIKVEIPAQPWGTSTTEAIQSGIMYGHAHIIEGFVQRYRAEPGLAGLTVFGCGGLFTTIASLCPGVDRSEAHLVNDGCLILSQRQGQEGL